MDSSKQSHFKLDKTATDQAASPRPEPSVRAINFDKQALDKQVRLGYLRNMLMADVARKDALKDEDGPASKQNMRKRRGKENIIVDENKPSSGPFVRQVNSYRVPFRDENRSVLNRNFAEQRRHAKQALERLDMPDSPSYNLEENNVADFSPENVAVPSRVDVHEGKASNKLMNEVFSWVKSLFLAFVLAFIFVTFVAQRNIVDGSSMYPTLYNGDNLIVEKVSRYFFLPPYGKIITFIKPKIKINYSEDSDGNLKRDVKPVPDMPDIHLVKRVIGLPGDTIEIKDAHVYRNGTLLKEDYLSEQVVTNVLDPVFAKVTLADDEIYVLGDNREHSSDSRYFGPIKTKSIVGRSLLRFYPFSRVGIPH